MSDLEKTTETDPFEEITEIDPAAQPPAEPSEEHAPTRLERPPPIEAADLLLEPPLEERLHIPVPRRGSSWDEARWRTARIAARRAVEEMQVEDQPAAEESPDEPLDLTSMEVSPFAELLEEPYPYPAEVEAKRPRYGVLGFLLMALSLSMAVAARLSL